METEIEYAVKEGAPPPKPRKHAELWQSYLWWNELMQLRKRHLLRISAIERGVSNMSAELEHALLENAKMDDLLADAVGRMIEQGETLGPTWAWITSIKGLGAGSLAAQLLAQIDDIGNFATISKLWRYAGYAVIDGEIDKCKPGEKSVYNRTLKSTCYLVASQFLRQQTPLYADIYYQSKEDDRRAHPEDLCREEGIPWAECTSKRTHHHIYNDGHIHNRALRKVTKIFLQHLWLTWRQAEGLPVSMPYVHDVLGHTHYIASVIV